MDKKDIEIGEIIEINGDENSKEILFYLKNKEEFDEFIEAEGMGLLPRKTLK